jgi:hypothetical protein
LALHMGSFTTGGMSVRCFESSQIGGYDDLAGATSTRT